jgi:hypothetical protein
MAHWHPVENYEGLYEVSEDGEVKSLSRIVSNGKRAATRKEKLLKQGNRGRGNLLYKFVVLTDGKGKKENKSVHRLVAEAFIPNPDNLEEVNHKDRNTFNNNVENLEWCTRQYNIEYSKNRRVAQYFDGEKIAEYKSISYASQLTGINRKAINNALSGWSNTAGGYEWKYIIDEEG